MSASARGARSLVLFILCAPLVASAADLSFGGPQSAFVGSAVSIPIVVSSPDLSINAISADISFPPDMLSITAVKKAPLLNFWTQEPSFSATAGTAKIEGVIFNPGWTGSTATAATLVIVPKKQGVATLSFSHASVLANDGQGTEVLKLTTPKTITINPAPPAAPKATVAQEAAQAASTTTTSTATTSPVIQAPTISSFTRVVDAEHPLVVAGSAPPGAQVELLLSSCAEAMAQVGLSAAADCGVATSRSTNAGADGVYVLVWDGGLAAGTYSITARAFVDGGVTAASKPQTIIVQETGKRTAVMEFLDSVALIFVMVLAAAGFIALSLGLMWLIRWLWRGLPVQSRAPAAVPAAPPPPVATPTPEESVETPDKVVPSLPDSSDRPQGEQYVTRLTWKR
jgi:hypothetical protein